MTKLRPRELAVLYCMNYLEASEFEPGAFITYTRLNKCFDQAWWRHGKSLDVALTTLEAKRLVTLVMHPPRIAGARLTETGRRIAGRISPYAALLWTGPGLVNRPY